LALTSAVLTPAQTRVDLGRQARNVDFRASDFTRPLKTGAGLPAQCVAGEMFVNTDDPGGRQIYACADGNQWAPVAGALNVEGNGAPIGTRGSANFISGLGLTTSMFDDGARISIQHSIDTAVVPTQADVQAGRMSLCRSASQSGTAYTCTMTPTLTQYTEGMVLRWIPDVANAGPFTLNVDALGARAVRLADGATTVSPGDLVPGRIYEVWYDGAGFRQLAVAGPMATPAAGWDMPFGSPASAPTTISDNTASYFAQFTPKQTEAVSKMGWRNGSLPAGKALALGIYDSACRLLAKGNTVGSAGAAAASLNLTPPVVLTHGSVYYIGFAVENTSTSLMQPVSAEQWGELLNAASGEIRYFRGAPPEGAGAAFALPAACGARDANGAKFMPAVILFP
jgi:hypothetical protein